MLKLVPIYTSNIKIKKFGGGEDCPQVKEWFRPCLAEYNTAISSGPKPPMLPSISWSPPLTLLFKINVDWAVFFVEAIIRDDKGMVEVALSKKIYTPLGAV